MLSNFARNPHQRCSRVLPPDENVLPDHLAIVMPPSAHEKRGSMGQAGDYHSTLTILVVIMDRRRLGSAQIAKRSGHRQTRWIAALENPVWAGLRRMDGLWSQQRGSKAERIDNAARRTGLWPFGKMSRGLLGRKIKLCPSLTISRHQSRIPIFSFSSLLFFSLLFPFSFPLFD